MNVDGSPSQPRYGEYAVLPAGKGGLARRNLAKTWIIPAVWLFLFFIICIVVGVPVMRTDPTGGALWFFTAGGILGGIAVVIGATMRSRSAIQGDHVYLPTVRGARRLVTVYGIALAVLFFVVPVVGVMAAPMSGSSGFAALFLWPVLLFATAFVLTARLALSRVLKRVS